MPFEPGFLKNKTYISKTCSICGRDLELGYFAKTNSPFYPTGYLPACNFCITEDLKKNNFDWKIIDNYCRCSDIPFIPGEIERIRKISTDDNFWKVYTDIFSQQEYNGINWEYYNDQFKELQKVGLIEDELPLLREQKEHELREKWGGNYDYDDLLYLEDLYKGILVSQNVNGALQIDQAKKLCKLSLEIDSRIRNGDKDIDKFMSSYDKALKTAEFTPKNAKNAVDFDSMAELVLWFEKQGFQNKYFDDVTRDVVDETLKNIESWTQKLYINEGGIGEDINNRIERLNLANQQEDFYDINESPDESYSDALFIDEEEEEFDVEGDEL